MRLRAFSAAAMMMGLLQCPAVELAAHIFPANQKANPITFIYHGVQYAAPVSVPGTNATADHSTPEKLIDSMLLAAKSGDNDRYGRLFEPGKKPESRLVANAAETTMSLLARLDYGPYTVLIVRMKSPDGEVEWPVISKKVGTNFFLCEGALCPEVELFQNTYIRSNLLHTFEINPPGSNAGLRITNFAGGDRASGPPIIMQVQQTNYVGGLRIHANIHANAKNLTTPEAASEAIFSAALTTNVSWYVELVSPNELDAQPIGGFSKTTVRDYVTTNLRIAAGMLRGKTAELTRRVLWGHYAIMFIRYKPDSGEEDWLVLKKAGNQWLLTDDLTHGEVVLSYLRGLKGYHDSAQPKVLPWAYRSSNAAQ